MKRSIVLISAVLIHQIAHSTLKEVPTISRETQTYNKDTKVGFEIINRSGNPIWFALQNGGNVYEENSNNAIELIPARSATKEQRRIDQFGRSLPPIGTIKRLEIDTNKDTILIIWIKDPGAVKIKDIFHPEYIALKKPDKMFTFTKGKTIYVYWSVPIGMKPIFPHIAPVWRLLPQVGGRKTKTGIVGITNLAFTNNVTDNDIRIVPVPL